jgi:NADH:ubiquinone oxidoreductase subunit C
MFKKLESFFPNILYYTINKENYIKISYEYAHSLIFLLKYHTGFKFQQLVDISAIDYPERKYRFEIFYNLLSFKFNNRVTVTTSISEDVSIESVTSIYPAANWYEREV